VLGDSALAGHPAGQVKLLDFGIAKLVETEHQPAGTMLTEEGAGQH